MNGRLRRLAQRRMAGIPIERIPTAQTPKELSPAKRQALGIPPRPTEEQLNAVSNYIGWAFGSNMPSVRQVMAEYVCREGETRSYEELATVLGVGFLFIIAVARLKGDDIEAAIAEAFGQGQ